MYGRLREAEDLYLQADKKDRKFLSAGGLLKAAMARLMTGDVPGASALVRQFADARAAMHDPAAPIYPAEWLWISGDRKAAMQQLQSFASAAETGAQKDLASRAYSDLAIWSLLAGDRAGAARLSLKAAALASPATAAAAIVARFLSQPPVSAAEWSARADQLFRNVPQSEIKELTLARALLLDRQFAAASAALRRLYEGPTTDPSVPVLLAWSLIETGRAAEAVPLLRFNPVPLYSGIDPLTGLYFPRLYELRARLGQDATANRQLFEKLGGK
jgi:Flp pilus assembly protein TadD